MDGILFFAEEHSFLQQCLFLMLVCGQNGHRMRVPRDYFTLRWKYAANRLVGKSDDKRLLNS